MFIISNYRGNSYPSWSAQNEHNNKPRTAPLVPRDRNNDIILYPAKHTRTPWFDRWKLFFFFNDYCTLSGHSDLPDMTSDAYYI